MTTQASDEAVPSGTMIRQQLPRDEPESKVNVDVEEANVPDLLSPRSWDQQSNDADEETSSTSPPGENGVREYIRKLSSHFSNPAEIDMDIQRLANVVQQAGEYAYGLAAIEVYLFSDPRLIPVHGGWWRDLSMEPCDAFAMLEDPNNGNYVGPEINIPGVGLVGVLWSSSVAGNHAMKGNSTFASMSRGVMAASSSVSSLIRNTPFGRKKAATEDKKASGARYGLCWRDLASLSEDPDTIVRPRLEVMRQAFFAKATGILFDAQGSLGMVVFYAKSGVDMKRLSAVVNETYLVRAASLIGSTLAMTEARRASIMFQQCYSENVEEHATTQEAKIKVPMQASSPSLASIMRANIGTWFHKCLGGALQIPPGMTLQQSLWTIFGVFVSLLILSSLNELFQFVSNSEYFLILGPFGALMTLQYGLTGAPASQPRNVVLGQIVAGAISLSATYIPESVLPIWVRQAVAPALAIGAMVRLGCTHPPAGASSIIFAGGKHNWGFYALVVLCSIISIVPATIINNLSKKRQYPTYWGYLPAKLSNVLRKNKQEA